MKTIRLTRASAFAAAIAGLGAFAQPAAVHAADRYWSGGSTSSDLIDQGANWYGGTNPSSGDNLYFNNTITRHWAQSNYGSGSYFGEIKTYNGAGGIRWLGDTTYALKFENFSDPNLFEVTSNIGNRNISGDQDLELNPVGSGGLKITGTVTVNGAKQVKVFGNNTLTLDGAVNGSGTSMTIQNAATVVLNASNGYTGGTSVNAGTLILGSSGSLSSGNVTVGAGGKLSGQGTIGGASSISGTHTVGGSNATGTQSFGNDLSYASSSIFEWDINTGADTADSVSVGGSLGITAGALFKVVSTTAFTDAFWNTTRNWNVFGGKDFDAFTLAFVANGSSQNAGDFASQGSFTFTNAGQTLTWTAIPEPSSILASGLLAAGLMRRRRQRIA